MCGWNRIEVIDSSSSVGGGSGGGGGDGEVVSISIIY